MIWSLISLSVSLIQSCKANDLSYPQFAQNGISIEERQRTRWPDEHWPTKTPNEVGLDKDALERAFAFAFDSWDSTDGVLVVRQGAIVGERYRTPYNQNKRHYLWSISKSVGDALIGRAEQLGIIRRDQYIKEMLPEFAETDTNKAALTVDHLLRMESGLEWSETYEYNPLFSDVLSMLYGRNSRDMGGFAGRKPALAEPGEQLYYSSGSSNLLCKLLRLSIGDQENYNRFPWRELFDKIGISSAVWEQDQAGTFVCSSYLHLTARDLARFGFLYLNNGRWNGDQILPETWVFTATTDTLSQRPDDYRYAYGSQWYMNFDRIDKKYPRAFPDAPPHTFWATGHWGQYLVIIPELDMIIVRFGDDRGSRFPMGKFIGLLLGK